jgi:hypothetical protein
MNFRRPNYFESLDYFREDKSEELINISHIPYLSYLISRTSPNLPAPPPSSHHGVAAGAANRVSWPSYLFVLFLLLHYRLQA